MKRERRAWVREFQPADRQNLTFVAGAAVDPQVP